jgi:hypothetical protein
LKIVIPDLRRPEYEHLFHDPKLAGMSKIARDYAVEMAYAQYTEQAILAGMFGNCAGMVRTTITAGSTAQTAINTGSLANGGASGNMDQTPNTTAIIATGHPGSGSTINQYTAPQFFKLTNSGATSLTIASQTVATAVTLGDAIFLGGSSSAGGATSTFPAFGMAQQLYIGLSTQAFSGATQANVLAGEPTSTGGYDRIGHGTSTPTPLWNNQANWPLPTAASPSVLTTANGPWSFPQSTAAWSTGATNLQTMFIADALTLGGGNVLAIGALGTAQAVNAAGITLSFANGAITLTLT